MIVIKDKVTGATLHTVDANTLHGAELSGVNMKDADLNGAQLSSAKLSGANLTGANLTRAVLSDAYLAFTVLTGADLTRAELYNSNLTGAKLIGAELTRANLTVANLTGSCLRDARLNSADMSRAYLNGADMTQADLTDAGLWDTTFVDCPTLHLAKGLEAVRHYAASSLDARTLRACVNHLPDIFLLGVGYNRQEIDTLRSLHAAGEKGGESGYCACFLSYARSDLAFVDRLHTDLLKNGVNCWKENDRQSGTRWKEELAKAIRRHEKMVLVCPDRFLDDDIVVREILRSLDEERSEGTQKFFPVCLDSRIFDQDVMDEAREEVRSGDWQENWVSHIRRHGAVDFSQWQEEPLYQKALASLLHELKHPQKRE